MEKNPLISIIIPVYQVEEYLKQCIESVLHQTYSNLEIILVDDGSADRSPKICDEYAAKDKRVKVIHKKNGGLVSARKAGIQIATGELIGYVDSDDWIDNYMYEAMLRKMQNCNADVIATDNIEEFPEYSVEERNYIEAGIYSGKKLVNEVFRKLLYVPATGHWGISANCWNKLFKREIVYRHQMDVDDRISDGEDHAFVFSAILDSKIFCITDDVFYHHRIRNESVSMDCGFQCIEKLAYLSEHLKRVFLQTPYWNEILSKQLPYHIRCFMYKYIDKVLQVPIIDYENCTKPYMFPFGKVRPGSGIILYGAADVGEVYYRQIKTTGYCDIIAWVAKKCDNAEKEKIVKRPEVIRQLNYDSIIIAAKSSSVAASIMNDLVIMGVPEDKIISAEPHLNTICEIEDMEEKKNILEKR